MSLAPHARLTDLAVVPREKPHTGPPLENNPEIPPSSSGRLFLNSGASPDAKYVPNWQLSDMQCVNWNVDSVIGGLEYLRRVGKENKLVYRVYSAEERKADPTKRPVNVIHLPGKRKKGDDTRKPFIILCAGGGYQEVWLTMEAGFHRLEIDFWDNFAEEYIEVGLKGPGISAYNLPASLLFHE